MHYRLKTVSCLAACAVIFLSSSAIANADMTKNALTTVETYKISNNVAAEMVEQKIAIAQEIRRDVAGQAVADFEIEEMLGTSMDKIAVAQVGDYVNVRAAAGENSDIIGKMYNGAAAALISTENGWSKIKSGNVEGYVKSDYLVVGDEALVRGAASIVATVQTSTLNIRSEATTDSSIVTQVGKDADLTIVANESEEWIQVSTSEGEGYVASEYVAVSKKVKTALTLEEDEAERMRTAAGKGQAVVSYAKQFIGNPYVWGGTSLTRGADCSGFVLSVYAHYGVSLSHSSYAMRSVGKAVSVSEMRPGDIVCYEGHVAIYAGNNSIVHAVDPGHGIQCTSPANYKNIVAVRRVFY